MWDKLTGLSYISGNVCEFVRACEKIDIKLYPLETP
jgi:hypothetical protein